VKITALRTNCKWHYVTALMRHWGWSSRTPRISVTYW